MRFSESPDQGSESILGKWFIPYQTKFPTFAGIVVLKIPDRTIFKCCYLKSESITFKEWRAIFRRALDVAELPVLFVQSAGGDVDLNVETVTHSLVQICQLNGAAFTDHVFLRR